MTAQDKKFDPNVQLQEIATELKALVADADAIDESKAKNIRRRWDQLAGETVDDLTLFAATKETLDQLREQIRRQVEKRDRLYTRLLDDLGQCEQAVKDGNLKQALSIEQSVSSRLKAIDGLSDQRREAVTTRVDALAPELSKLKQWRHWGTAHARENLIAEIEALIGSDRSPSAIARDIQKARQVWKGWDKSGDSAPKTLWEKFDKTCTRAYEPCQKHFKAQAEERAKNLTKRQAICNDLELIENESDWKAPEWREIDKRIQQLRQDYRRSGPVDRQQRGKIEARYAAADEKLEGRLSRERTRNRKSRIALTEEVAALKDTEDLPSAIERVKELQKLWRPTVLSSRRDERKLWQQFRAACDEVFAQRDAARQSQSEQQKENVKIRSALLKEFENEMNSNDDAARNLFDRFSKIREQWANAGDVGARNRSDLDKRFRKFTKALESKVRAIRRQRAQQADVLLANVDALLAQYEAAYDTSESLEESEVAATPIKAYWPDLTELPVTIRSALQNRYDQVTRFESGTTFDEIDGNKGSLAANELQQQTLCLKLEVAADVDSPPAYAKERMQLKVARLNQAMSGGSARGGNKDTDDDPRQLLRDVWCTGPVTPTCRRDTGERLKPILAKLLPDLRIDPSSLESQPSDQPMEIEEPVSEAPAAESVDEPVADATEASSKKDDEVD